MKRSNLIFLLPAMIPLLLACGLAPAVETPTASTAPAFQPLTIKGTYEMHLDTQAGEAFTYNAEKIDTTATFTATSQADSTLKGTAQVTYTEAYQFKYDEQGFQPCAQAWTTEPITWTAELTGRVQQNADGSLTVVLLANPKDGPSFSQNFDCEGPKTKTPEFAYIAGVLVNGEYKHKSIYQLHPMLVGSQEETTIMELVP
jgi:hypothetical protein